MKKKLIYLTLILTFFLLNLNGESIHYSPGQVFVGTQVNFGIQSGPPSANINASANANITYRWNFGDGTAPATGPQSSVSHVYMEPGNFDVRCEKRNPNSSGQPQVFTTRVSVTDRRTVRAKGSGFMAGSPVGFETQHFIDNTLNWDFGDGTSNNGQQAREHTYQNPGNYTVKVKDQGGSSSSVITCTVNIAPDNRSIEFQPASPMAGRSFSFRARNFSSANLKWDFSDGVVSGGPEIEHTFSAQGNYNVKVTDMGIGPGSFITQRVIVAPDNRSIAITPQNPSLYEEVTFNARNFNPGPVEWDFDRDGKKNGGPMEKHTFANMGTFNVKAREAGSDAPFVNIRVSISRDKRNIQISPPSAMVGQDVSIRLMNSSAGTVNWKIGNVDRINNSPKDITYKFKDPGRIELLAEIQGQTPVRGSISVNDNRTISLKKDHIFEKTEVVFMARNFNTRNLKWDPGDGSVRNGGAKFTHKYMRPGIYRVKVFDFDGTSKTPVQLRINVMKDNRGIVAGKKIIFENSEIEFVAKDFIKNRIRWNLGDGTDKRGSRKIKHKYSKAGQYRIFAVDFDGKGDKKIDLMVEVKKDNRVVSAPMNIIVGVPFTMQVKNSQGGNFEWKFPGGGSSQGSMLSSKIFNTPGMKKVTITDKSGLYPPITKTFNVLPDDRSLNINKEIALKGQTVKFSADNFKGIKVRWDFGDGKPAMVLSKTITHKFNSAGSFKVSAVDYAGEGKKTFSKTLVVKEQMDDFLIGAIELTFNNGKYYRIVPMKSFSPGYMLRIKSKGQGIINGNWLVDGLVFGMFSKLLAGNSLIVIKGSEVPKLPVLDPGIHSLSFEFTNYKFEGKIPILRYFVTNSGAIRTISPSDGAKLTAAASVRLKWKKRKKGDKFEILVSQIPFQFMVEKSMKWKKIGENNYFDLDVSPFDKGSWIYWQLRMVDATGTVSTASEISYFKILKTGN